MSSLPLVYECTEARVFAPYDCTNNCISSKRLSSLHVNRNYVYHIDAVLTNLLLGLLLLSLLLSLRIELSSRLCNYAKTHYRTLRLAFVMLSSAIDLTDVLVAFLPLSKDEGVEEEEEEVEVVVVIVSAVITVEVVVLSFTTSSFVLLLPVHATFY